jgi:hypothetical protein
VSHNIFDAKPEWKAHLVRPKHGYHDIIDVGVKRRTGIGLLWGAWRAHEHGGDMWRASCCALHVCTNSDGVLHDSWY